MKRTAVLLLSLMGLMASSSPAQQNAPAIRYRVSMEKPQTHYFTVTVTVADLKKPSLDFVLPVWTPGSYLVREFARNVQEFTATDGSDRPLPVEKINKNTWRVASRNASPVTVQYRVYAYEVSVRTSFLDDMHGYINGASVFMYVDGHQGRPATVVIDPPEGWRTVSTALERVPGAPDPFTYTAPNYDILADSPMEIGTHPVYTFTVRDVPHEVAVYGIGNYDPERLVADMRRVVETAVEIFNDLPYPRYVFLVQLLPSGGGGLEHQNSASLHYRRWGFRPESVYRRWLGLVAHEYFHLWNVKRIRPQPLGPFDYTRENYTSLLWVAEGFTTYYSAQILRRADLTQPEEFLGWASGQISDVQAKPGRRVQSVEEASFDAWIKYYRPNENSDNATISYYNKGALIGLLLDLEIRHRTEGKKSLDDVMRSLYTVYAREKGRGFSPAEFRQTCESVAGGPLADIFDRYVSDTEEIDYDRYLGYAGLRLAARPSEGGGAYLGIKTRKEDGRMIVSQVIAGSPAYTYGINVNDELIAIDGIRADDAYADRLAERQPASIVTITVARDGILREIDVILAEPPPTAYQVERIAEPSPAQRAVYEGWTHSAWPAQ
jgi:predicted metalloprotease with PDZ domain